MEIFSAKNENLVFMRRFQLLMALWAKPAPRSKSASEDCCGVRRTAPKGQSGAKQRAQLSTDWRIGKNFQKF
ncbi:MAG: hypothetical protein DWI29_02165 [Planctomycetota bacterium]|nr:MAG: hypothetical protein DWI29_02165 [Planctomycetota bacterium]